MTVYVKDDIQTSPKMKKVLDTLVSLADESGNIIMTKPELAEKTGYSPRTICRWLTQAEEEGYLTTARRAGRLGRTAIYFTDKAVEGRVVANPVSNPTEDMNERLNNAIQKEVHVAQPTGLIRGKYAKRRSAIEIQREKDAKLLRHTRYGKLNAKVAEVYKQINNCLSYQFFVDNFEDKEECDHEYLTWLVSKLYDSYFKETTRGLQARGAHVSVADGYESLDTQLGYFGSRNYLVFSGVVKSYRDKGQLQNMTMLIANMFSRRYHGAVKHLENGGDPKGVHPKWVRPFPNKLYLEHSTEALLKSYDNIHDAMRTTAEENGKPFKDTDALATRILRTIGTDTLDSVPCALVVDEINSFLGFDGEHNKKVGDSSNEYGAHLKRQDTLTIVNTFEFLTPQSEFLADRVGITPEQLKDYVMYSRYYGNVMSYAENQGMTREELDKVQDLVVEYINYKRFGLDTPIETFDSTLSILVSLGMSDATSKIMYDPELDDLEKRDKIIRTYASMLPDDYYRRYLKGDKESLMYKKFLRSINMLFNFYYEGRNYTQGLAYVLIKSKNERLGRTSDVHAIQETASKVKDVLMLNSMGLPDWDVVRESLLNEDDLQARTYQEEDKHLDQLTDIVYDHEYTVFQNSY